MLPESIIEKLLHEKLTCIVCMMTNDFGQQHVKCNVPLPLWPDVGLFYQCKCYLNHTNIQILQTTLVNKGKGVQHFSET